MSKDSGLSGKNQILASIVSQTEGERNDTGGIVVPSRGTTRILVRMLIPQDYKERTEDLDQTFTGSVALLKLTTTTGKARTFRIATSSFWGDDLVTWPEESKYPFYNTHSKNAEKGYDLRNRLRSGRKPQKRIDKFAKSAQK